MALLDWRDARGRVCSLHNVNTKYTGIIHKTGGAIYRGRAVDGKVKSYLEWRLYIKMSLNATGFNCDFFVTHRYWK